MSESSIELTWTDMSSDETGFVIERSTSTSGPWGRFSVGPNVASFTDSGLSASTTYIYRLAAQNSDGISTYVGPVGAMTMVAGISLPTAPSGLVATSAASDSISLSWLDNSNNETGFRIERGTTSTGPFTQIATTSTGVTTYSDTGLTASTTYYFRVRANNSAGDSAFSSVATATTLTTTTRPVAPSSLAATAASSSSISLSWVDNSNNETGFRIERATGSTGGSFTQIATVGAGVVAFSDTGRAASTTYRYRVRANNSAGDSAFSNVAIATTPSTTPPAAPSGLAATPAASDSISLSWLDNSNNETVFRIERGTGSNGGSFDQITTVGAGVVAFSDTGRAASTTYRYRVRANNSAGDSAFSNVATATTLSTTTLPEAPSSLVATSTSSTSISLSWVDNSNNETGFRIERGTTSTGPFTELAATSEGVTAYSNKDLTASTTYYYRVRANNSAGDSDYSDVANATTLSVSTSVTLFPSADNLVLVNSDDVPIADTVFQSAELVVGCNWGMNLLIQTSVCGQSLVRFDVSTLSGNAIDSATLRLTTNYAGVGVFPRTWQIWAIASDWSPTTVTWNMVSLFQYYLDHRINNLVPPTSIGQIIDLDVKEIVQAWANGTFLNNGMMFQVSNSDPPNAISNDAFAFYSLEHTGQEWPRLIVTYH
jgi:titin